MLRPQHMHRVISTERKLLIKTITLFWTPGMNTACFPASFLLKQWDYKKTRKDLTGEAAVRALNNSTSRSLSLKPLQGHSRPSTRDSSQQTTLLSSCCSQPQEPTAARQEFTEAAKLQPRSTPLLATPADLEPYQTRWREPSW